MAKNMEVHTAVLHYALTDLRVSCVYRDSLCIIRCRILRQRMMHTMSR